jgi:hypothetical protein
VTLPRYEFHGPSPLPADVAPGSHMLVIAFLPDGTTSFGAASNAEILAAHMRALLREMIENPSLVAEACGLRTPAGESHG